MHGDITPFMDAVLMFMEAALPLAVTSLCHRWYQCRALFGTNAVSFVATMLPFMAALTPFTGAGQCQTWAEMIPTQPSLVQNLVDGLSAVGEVCAYA